MSWLDTTLLVIGRCQLDTHARVVHLGDTTADWVDWHQHKASGYDAVIVGGECAVGPVRAVLYFPPGGWWMGHLRLPVPLLRAADSELTLWRMIGATGLLVSDAWAVCWDGLLPAAARRMGLMHISELTEYLDRYWMNWVRSMADSKMWAPLVEILPGVESPSAAAQLCAEHTDSGIVLPCMFLRAVAKWGQ